jgi:two-component system cell cycle response regulator
VWRRVPPPRRHRLAVVVGQVALAAGAALAIVAWVYTAAESGNRHWQGISSTWIYDAAFFAASLGCLAVAIGRPERRIIAGALGTGMLLFSLGNVIYSLAPDPGAVPVPSASDPLWLAIYPCEYLALLALTRQRTGHALLATRLDGIQSGLAAAALVGCVTLPAAMRGAAGGGFWNQATLLAYPLGDLILIGAVVSAVGLAGWRLDRTLALAGLAIVAWESADLIYLFDSSRVYIVADSLVMTGGVGLAAALSLARIRPVARDVRQRGLFVPIGFGLAALAVVLLGAPLHLNGVAVGTAGVSLALALLRMALALRENQSLLGASRVEATTDMLTGLRNRRALDTDLAEVLRGGRASAPHLLVLLDLNGFKAYNDGYGHGAGDELLARLGRALAAEVGAEGTAYRMGGDEFCVLAPMPADVPAFAERCAGALADHGDAFSITAAHGEASIPDERYHPASALALADARMYQNKNGLRLPAAHQSAEVLLALLREQAPALLERMREVSETAVAIATELGTDGEELEALRYAAALHDIGKIAIPGAILDKPGPLTDDEWHLVRHHPLIGERILGAAPALAGSARLVRASHERVDGRGYPDGLAGDEIPVASRIILVSEAFHAMTSVRPYAAALTDEAALNELRRCAGTQFDPPVVDALARVLGRSPAVRPT